MSEPKLFKDFENPLIIDEYPTNLDTFALIDYFKTKILSLNQNVYINIPTSFKATRCAVLACDGNYNVIVNLISNQKLDFSSKAALKTLQDMGISTFILDGVLISLDSDNDVCATDNHDIHYIDANINFNEKIICSSNLAQDVLENSSGAIHLTISDEAELSYLEELQYIINRPLCIESENEEIFEKALIVFRGLAIYNSIPETQNLKKYQKKYGLIVL